MKYFRLITFVFLYVCGMLYSHSLQAQTDNSSRFKAIENEKIAYIAKELNLTTKEAQQFFPIYNAYSNQIWDVRRAKARLQHAKTEKPSSSSRIPNNFFRSGSGVQNSVIEYDAKEVEIKKEYWKKFSEVIGEARSSEFFEVEQRFRESLIKELHKRNKR